MARTLAQLVAPVSTNQTRFFSNHPNTWERRVYRDLNWGWGDGAFSVSLRPETYKSHKNRLANFRGSNNTPSRLEWK